VHVANPRRREAAEAISHALWTGPPFCASTPSPSPSWPPWSPWRPKWRRLANSSSASFLSCLARAPAVSRPPAWKCVPPCARRQPWRLRRPKSSHRSTATLITIV